MTGIDEHQQRRLADDVPHPDVRCGVIATFDDQLLDLPQAGEFNVANDEALIAAVIDAWREFVREAFIDMEEHARVAWVPQFGKDLEILS